MALNSKVTKVKQPVHATHPVMFSWSWFLRRSANSWNPRNFNGITRGLTWQEEHVKRSIRSIPTPQGSRPPLGIVFDTNFALVVYAKTSSVQDGSHKRLLYQSATESAANSTESAYGTLQRGEMSCVCVQELLALLWGEVAVFSFYLLLIARQCSNKGLYALVSACRT